jgi:hypothetical protein
MRAIILFDGSRTSELSLQAACRDAYQVWHTSNGQPSQPLEALVITFEAITAANLTEPLTTRSQSHARLLLEQAVNNLEGCGEFDKISGEVIHCAPAELTQVLIDRAREWQSDSVYLPLKSRSTILPASTKQARVSWLGRLGLGARPEAQPQALELNPHQTLSTPQIEITRLMEQAQCRIVLTDAEGIAMKLHYVPAASSAASYTSKSKQDMDVA